MNAKPKPTMKPYVTMSSSADDVYELPSMPAAAMIEPSTAVPRSPIWSSTMLASGANRNVAATWTEPTNAATATTDTSAKYIDSQPGLACNEVKVLRYNT